MARWAWRKRTTKGSVVSPAGGLRWKEWVGGLRRSEKGESQKASVRTDNVLECNMERETGLDCSVASE